MTTSDFTSPVMVTVTSTSVRVRPAVFVHGGLRNNLYSPAEVKLTENVPLLALAPES